MNEDLSLTKDMAKTMGSFKLDALIEKLQKSGTDPKIKIHNHCVSEAVWTLVDDGEIIPDCNGTFKLKE